MEQTTATSGIAANADILIKAAPSSNYSDPNAMKPVVRVAINSHRIGTLRLRLAARIAGTRY